MKRLAIAALPLALAACMTPATGDPPLAGSKWRFQSIDGATPVAAETSLEFGERLSANAGCNGLSGPWRLEGGVLAAGPLVSTRKFCAGLMEQENAVSALLSGNPAVTVEGDRLTLSGGGHAAVLLRAD